MAPPVAQAENPPKRIIPRIRFGGSGLTRGLVTGYLSIMVLLPIAAILTRAFSEGDSLGAAITFFWDAISSPDSVRVLKLTFLCSLAVVVINGFFGTIIAWILVRDDFPGKKVLNMIIDLPFALPTIVAGLTLLALYGDSGATEGTFLHITFVQGTQIGVILALLFVTMPFVVRSVQPTLMELDKDMEEAAASLGASGLTIFRRVILPNLMPALMAGAALAFARAIGEFGSLVLLSNSFDTKVASIYIFEQVEAGRETTAASVSLILLVLSVSVLFAIQWFGRRVARG
jgi:sulfate/thiosulfate transport system permease protein